MYPKNVKKLIFDFFYVFARFDYALKQTEEFYKLSRIGNRIEADWISFAESLSLETLSTLITENPDVEILTNEPPKVEIEENGHKRWVAMSSMNDMPDMKNLILSIKQVRNNLFHGGKFSNGFPDGGSRNEELVKAALVALRFLKTQNSDVSKIYDAFPVEL